VCLDLEDKRAKCEAGPIAACDAFATAFERLLPECRPTGSERRVADGSSGCVDVEVGGHRVYDAALATLLQTADRRPGRARDLFQSERFSATLSGEYAESYVPRSLNMSRASRGLPPIDWEEDIGLSATASSTLPAQSGNRYDPALAVDAKLDTAWCEGAPGDGVGEWIEVRVERPQGNRTPLCEVQIVPGYAKSQAAYRANGRVTRVRLASCQRSEAHLDLDVSETKAWPPTVALEVPPGALDDAAACFRLTILRASKETYPDTCISNILPFFCAAAPTR
jgi:hypothetical protein